MAYITAIALAGTAIYGAIEANERKKKAARQIEQLKKFRPQYKSAEQIQAEGERAIPFGYSPSERANFQQAMARRSNAVRRIATDRNPNLAGAINAGINYGNIQGELGFAAQDAALRRQRVSEYVSRLTGQNNLQTSADLTTKMQQEIAYGNAKSQANADIYNSLMQLGYAGASAAKAGVNSSGRYGTPTITSTSTVSSDATGAITEPLQSPYQRKAAPLYQDYQQAYQPYGQINYGTPPSRLYNPYNPNEDIYNYQY